MAIDWELMSEAQRGQLVATGYRVNREPILGAPKSKKPQQGRGENQLEPYGKILASVRVEGRAVAWQTHGRPHPALRRWQRHVATCCRMAKKIGQSPYRGPVRLMIYIDLKRSKNGRHPDLTNMQKAIEDAAQGILYVNDLQVKQVRAELSFQEVSVTQITVQAID